MNGVDPAKCVAVISQDILCEPPEYTTLSLREEGLTSTRSWKSHYSRDVIVLRGQSQTMRKMFLSILLIASSLLVENIETPRGLKENGIYARFE